MKTATQILIDFYNRQEKFSDEENLLGFYYDFEMFQECSEKRITKIQVHKNPGKINMVSGWIKVKKDVTVEEIAENFKLQMFYKDGNNELEVVENQIIYKTEAKDYELGVNGILEIVK
jgi:hypothetical protein